MFSLVGEYISPDDICSVETAPGPNDVVAGQHINIFLTIMSFTVKPQLFTRGGCNIFKSFLYFSKKKKKKKFDISHCFVLSTLS